ncbi:MAG TPA: D-hexose-6-phosphate mutarotase [Thermoflexales bacterium]|nr:D-hexose-6-phosphate mutarotase [Thermoflexales bacterium]
MEVTLGAGPSTSSGPSAAQPITLTASGGARAIVWPQGAQVASWIPAGGSERLFLSQHPSGGPGGLRGGVPVIFPQFGGFGPLPFHGFARGLVWDLVAAASHPDDGRPHGPGDGEAMAEFALRDNEATRTLWPHAFRATLSVHAGGPRLRVALGVTNAGAQPFSFTAALHTYIRVADLVQTTLEGLTGLTYLDHQNGDVVRTESEPRVGFSGPVDRIYYAVPGAIVVREPERQLWIEATGFPDAVVWTPWNGAVKNLEPDGFRHFVCVEAAAVRSPITLPPGARWTGEQTLIA